MKNPGRLYLLGTTIGNYDDFPKRSLAILGQADLLVFEEDAPARQALKAAGIHRTYLKLTEHREAGTLEEVEAHLRAGKVVAYMSDQGMPNLADPGRQLVEVAHKTGAQIKVVPGPCSLSAAVAACSFVTEGFYFYGFLPRKQDERVEALKKLRDFPDPIVLFDTPYRRQAVLQDVSIALGSERLAFIATEIGNSTESYWEGTIGKIKDRLKEVPEDQNFVLIIACRHGKT